MDDEIPPFNATYLVDPKIASNQDLWTPLTYPDLKDRKSTQTIDAGCQYAFQMKVPANREYRFWAGPQPGGNSSDIDLYLYLDVNLKGQKWVLVKEYSSEESTESIDILSSSSDRTFSILIDNAHNYRGIQSVKYNVEHANSIPTENEIPETPPP
jgi:hypothetical protein